MGYDYSRGTYLIVLADSDLMSTLTADETGNFIEFKKTQGYDIKIINFGDEVRFANSLEEKAAYISHTVRQFFLGTYSPCDANFTDTGMDTNAISNTSQTTISFSGTKIS